MMCWCVVPDDGPYDGEGWKDNLICESGEDAKNLSGKTEFNHLISDQL